ncbi:MAG: hypothetical protein ACOVQ2_10175, partial [Flavobacterium sp.]
FPSKKPKIEMEMPLALIISDIFLHICSFLPRREVEKLSILSKEQYEIPFIVWTSNNYKKLKPKKQLSQNHVFHSVLKFLSLESPIYNEEMNIFNE